VDEVLAAGRLVAGADEELKQRFDKRLKELRKQLQQSLQPPNGRQSDTAGPPPPADAMQPVIAP
jgi:hypothetical protein